MILKLPVINVASDLEVTLRTCLDVDTVIRIILSKIIFAVTNVHTATGVSFFVLQLYQAVGASLGDVVRDILFAFLTNTFEVGIRWFRDRD